MGTDCEDDTQFTKKVTEQLPDYPVWMQMPTDPLTEILTDLMQFFPIIMQWLSHKVFQLGIADSEESMVW